MSRLTIVMYHYVRDLPRTRYPAIKGLTVEGFRGQLDFLSRHYRLVGAADLVAALRDPAAALPANAALLTFDDGYADHYQAAFPILHERGIQGLFFPLARPVLEGRVLDVNKVHFILAAQPDTTQLADTILATVAARRAEFGLREPDDYWQTYAKASRYDPPEVVFVKRMLQKGLPEALRAELADDLFRAHVSADEAAFAAELYASVDQLRTMARCGMYIGPHGYDHYWMDQLDAARQEEEIGRALDFMRQIGAPTRDWIMCYPHGAHDPSLLEVLRRHGCAAGLTTQTGLADLGKGGDDPLLLPRLDTNDLPKAADAPPGPWTLKASGDKETSRQTAIARARRGR
jgi:peptidoglycan/xylan/chitin deacetylase (PgdA/CDA1 family)